MCLSAGLYGVLLGGIAVQKQQKISSWRELLIHAQLILFTVILLYFVGIQRFLIDVPLPKTLVTLFTLFLYFIGIALYRSWKSMLFYLPFVLPFTAYLFLAELLSPLLGEWILYVLAGIFGVFFLSLFPFVLRLFWNCAPLPSSSLKIRLEKFCKAQHFRHGGMQAWKGLRGVTTAAIIGVLPRVRYVLFTEPLLRTFPEDEIEAILAHEIGHSRYKHLVLYPCLLLGLLPIYHLLNQALFLQPPLLVLACDGVVILGYFRFIFGFFSRHFEKQADLFTVSAGLPAGHLISALERLAAIHLIPLSRRNWHHGSIEKRIKTLQQAMLDPSLPRRHGLFLKRVLLAYFILVVITYFFS